MEVNAELDRQLLTNALGEGPRASKAVWSADKDTLFNVPEPVLTWSMDLLLNGTIHTVTGKVKVLTGAQ